MDYISIFDQIIDEVSPDDLPVEYIILARVVDFAGVERELRGDELIKFINHPMREFSVLQACILLDVAKMREVMLENILTFFESVDQGARMLPPVWDDTI